METSQYIPHDIIWREPLELAASIDEGCFVLLYSGVRSGYSGRYSFLACDLRERITSNDFSVLAEKLSSDRPCFSNAWFGYLGYGLKNTLENLVADENSFLGFPDLQMMRFGKIYQFDHDNKNLTLWTDSPDFQVPEIKTPQKSNFTKVKNITSNMKRAEYLEKVAHIIERIYSGDLYQANLTRKFYGEFATKPDCFQIFARLCQASPALYSAFMKIDDSYIISSSPESFLSVDAAGNITTRPIKGSAPRGADQVSDERLREQLSKSEKDRAENLMIVDLMRNDLSKCCVAGSVKTDSLFDITTHATIHHISSTISGKKMTGLSTLDVVKTIFPAGSMTGAPKISAMNLCSKLEGQERGVYSGAIGWFGGDGSCDLSVVIRTLLVKGNKFEFQAGGGIVADSVPEQELEELLNKAKGILLALDIPVSAIDF